MQTEEMFKVKKPIIAMLHLDPLPGDPMWKYGMNMDQVVENAKADLIALQEGGVDGIIFSNEFSFPYQRNMDKVIPLEIMTDKYNQYFIITEDVKKIVASSKKRYGYC